MGETIWANRLPLDLVITSADGAHVGMVDDLEFTEMNDGGPPKVTAFLCGPSALGSRFGGRLGSWWLATGRRLRPDGSVYPNRIPVEVVKTLDLRGIELELDAGDVPTRALHDWLREHIVSRIPGNGGS